MAHDVDGIWDLVQSNGVTVRVDIVQPRCPGGLADGELQGAAQEVGAGGLAPVSIRYQRRLFFIRQHRGAPIKFSGRGR